LSADDYSKSISLGHNEAALYFKRGMLLVQLRAGYLEEKVEDYEKAIALNPDIAPLHYLQLGIIYYDGVGKVGIARDYFKKTIAVDPNGDMGKKAKEYLKKMR
jgi:tetratricopeptide (TPR) repeat protein